MCWKKIMWVPEWLFNTLIDYQYSKQDPEETCRIFTHVFIHVFTHVYFPFDDHSYSNWERLKKMYVEAV